MEINYGDYDHVVVNEAIVPPSGGDGLQIRGGKWLILGCKFSGKGLAPDSYDEALDIASDFDKMIPADVTILGCSFTDLSMPILIGNHQTDGPREKAIGLKVDIRDTLFDGNCRRQAYIHGGTLLQSDCIIKNWGLPETFHEKSYGTRIGHDAQGYLKRCIYSQPNYLKFLTSGNFCADLIQWDGWPAGFRAGFQKAAYSEEGGSIRAEQCYRNKFWLHIENSNNELWFCEGRKLERDIMKKIQEYQKGM